VFDLSIQPEKVVAALFQDSVVRSNALGSRDILYLDEEIDGRHVLIIRYLQLMEFHGY
jgi:hypothetical protein